jgi:hypothetical protein
VLKKPIKRKIKIEKVKRIVISKISDMFVFKVEGEYDYLFISEHKCEILLRMNE